MKNILVLIFAVLLSTIVVQGQDKNIFYFSEQVCTADYSGYSKKLKDISEPRKESTAIMIETQKKMLIIQHPEDEYSTFQILTDSHHYDEENNIASFEMMLLGNNKRFKCVTDFDNDIMTLLPERGGKAILFIISHKEMD